MEGHILIIILLELAMIAMAGYMLQKTVGSLRELRTSEAQFIASMIEYVNLVLDGTIQDYVKNIDSESITFKDLDKIVIDILQIAKQEFGSGVMKYFNEEDVLIELIKDKIKSILQEKLNDNK